MPASVLRPDYDYCALGHYHKYLRIAENAYYSGSTERLGFDDAGQEKGFLDVELDTQKIRFVPLKIRSMIDFPTLPETAVPYLRVALIAVVALVAWIFLQVGVRVSTRGLLERRALEEDAATMPPLELERRVNTIGRLVLRIGGVVIVVMSRT